jgi:hypothetical protein
MREEVTALSRTSWRAGRIAGIEIRADSSCVVIALLITYSMYLTQWLRRWRTLDGRALDSRSDRRNLDRRY